MQSRDGKVRNNKRGELRGGWFSTPSAHRIADAGLADGDPNRALRTATCNGKFVEATAKKGGIARRISEQKPSPQELRRTHGHLAHHGAASARDGGTHGRPAGGPRDMGHQSGLSEAGGHLSFGS